MKITCEYGCGQEAKHQFKNGKWCCSKSYNSCLKTRMRNSESNKGKTLKPRSKDHRKKLSESNKGKIPWNRGIKHSKETKRKISESLKGKISPNKGKKLTKKTKRKISESKKGKKHPLYGKKHPNRLTIYKINKKYPFFSKVEEMRYNPDKLGEKEIQVHCKNSLCKNSKEKDGWFSPIYIQLYERIRALEYPHGMIENNFYCLDECKNSCDIFKRRSDPYKNIDLPYTYEEIQTWKVQVKELDNNQCQICGTTENIHVHHIIPVKLEPFFALDPVNGICLCEKCHYKIGHQGECSTGNLAKKEC